MSWTTPPTFASGTVVTASNLNILSADLSYLKTSADGVAFSGVKVARTSALSVANTTDTNIPWQTESLDVGAWWSSGTAITVPASAVPSGFTTVALLVIGYVRFVSNGTGGRILRLIQNGTGVESTSVSALAGETTSVAITSVVTAAAGDVISGQAYQSSGGALNMDVAKFTVLRLAPVS